jgi:hypothetical protein
VLGGHRCGGGLNAASAASLRLRCFDLARTDCLGFTFTEQDKGFRMTQKPRPLSVALWSAGSSGPDSAASSFFCRYIHGNRYIHIMTRSSLPRVLGLRRHRPCQAQYWVQVCRLGTGVSTGYRCVDIYLDRFGTHLTPSLEARGVVGDLRQKPSRRCVVPRRDESRRGFCS